MGTQGFMIKAGNSNFLNKQKDIFDSLTAVDRTVPQKTKNSDPYQEVEISNSKKRKRNETKVFRGKESLFKEPQDLPPRRAKPANVPDFQKNPQKWMKYSLADVSAEELSNDSNTAVALAFLRTVKQRKSEEIAMDVEDETTETASTHKFQAKSDSRRNLNKPETSGFVIDDSIDTKPTFKNSKIIMPEYVVGGKKVVKKTKKPVLNQAQEKIHLGHLFQNEDE